MYSTKWSVIARHIPGRTDDACSKRYREALDPSLKKDDWTPEEDDKLLEAYARLGGKWGQIGQELSRSGLGCRNRSVYPRICMSAIHLTQLHRWRLLSRKKLTAHSTRVPPNPSSSTSSGHVTPLVDWNNLSMLDVTRFLDIDKSNSYGPGRSTFEHNPSYVRTQELSRNQLPSSSTSSFWNDNDMSYAQSQPSLRLDFSSMQARDTPSIQQHPPPDFDHDLSLSSELFDAFQPCSLVDTRTAAEDPEERVETYSPLVASNAHIPDNAGNSTGFGTTTRPVENSTPYHNVSPPTSPSSGNPFQLTRDVCDSQEDSNSLHTDNALEPPMSESTAPLCHSACGSPPPTHSSPYYRSPLERSARKNSKDTQALLTLNSDLTATAESVLSSLLDSIQCSFIQLYSPSIKPYACGHQLCWPVRETKSCACFATSRELNDHSKTSHADDILGGGKPFRCGLDGCTKSWKSINGLQYHLQVCVNVLIYNRGV